MGVIMAHQQTAFLDLDAPEINVSLGPGVTVVAALMKTKSNDPSGINFAASREVI